MSVWKTIPTQCQKTHSFTSHAPQGLASIYGKISLVNKWVFNDLIEFGIQETNFICLLVMIDFIYQWYTYQGSQIIDFEYKNKTFSYCFYPGIFLPWLFAVFSPLQNSSRMKISSWIIWNFVLQSTLWLYDLCWWWYQWLISGGPRIFPRGCANSQKCHHFSFFFAENCMKMKEFRPQGEACVPGASPLDPPMLKTTLFLAWKIFCVIYYDTKISLLG